MIFIDLARANIPQDSVSSSSHAVGSPKSIGISPLGNIVITKKNVKNLMFDVIVVSGTGQESSVRRGSTQSDTSALVSSITRDFSQSPSQATQPRDLSPSPSSSSLHTRSETSPPHTPTKKDASVSVYLKLIYI